MAVDRDIQVVAHILDGSGNPMAISNANPLPVEGSVSVSNGYSTLSASNNGSVPIGETSVQSGVITANRIILCATGDCYVAVGSSPTANSSSTPLLGTKTMLPVNWNSGDKLAVIQMGSSTGYVYYMAVG